MANGLWVCNDMNKNGYIWFIHRVELFGSWLNFTYSFLQNVLAKIMSINNIYKSLTVAYERN